MKRAWIELIVLLVNIGVVLSLFHVLDRKPAAVLAGFLFIAISAGIIWVENKKGRGQRSFAWWSAILFLAASAIPIFVLRIVFWNLPFEQVGYWGIRGPELHKISNYLYLLLVASVVIEGLRKDP